MVRLSVLIKKMIMIIANHFIMRCVNRGDYGITGGSCNGAGGVGDD